MHEYYDTHKMKERIDRLYETHETMSRDSLRKRLNAWDIDQGRAMMSAKKALRIQPKPHNWSPALRNSAIIMRYWKLRQREILYDEDNTETFARWEHQIQ